MVEIGAVRVQDVLLSERGSHPMSASEYAALHGISVLWVRHLIRVGRLKAKKIEREWEIEEGATIQRVQLGRPKKG